MLSGGRLIAIFTSAGLCMIFFAIRRMFSGIVAENMIVCRSPGRCSTIFIISS